VGQDEFEVWFGEPVQEYAPPHDQRHSLNATASVELGKWQGSVRWQYGSGRPYTAPIGFDAWHDLRELPELRDELGATRFLFKRPYAARLPSYHRLDVSVERRFDLGLGELTLQAGAINAYNRNNLFYYDLFRSRRVDQLPFVPYLSLKMDTLP
jgi:outer membrane receptor protein involved in Fe transport